MPSPRSRYTILVDNLSTSTRTADLEDEFRYAGKIRDIVRDGRARCALIEFDRSSDADYAWRKFHMMMLHGRELKIDFATPSDYKFFGWKWTEGGLSPSPKRGRSYSRSKSRSPSRSRSRSRTPPDTPAKGQTDGPEHAAKNTRGESEKEESPRE